MKFTEKSKKKKQKKRKDALISDIIKSKTKQLQVPKLLVTTKRNFEQAKTLLKKINGSECDGELSFSEEPLRELSLADIMGAINELTREPDMATKSITDCSSHMASDSEIFWTSPRVILRAIKHSILRRDWDSITHLLLLLLQHKDHYVPIVQKLCIFISKYNPMIEKLGLLEEFNQISRMPEKGR
ncbi:uncharacterized protein LOC123683776 [Harmonia axyridis]|uniref:uncharacterized protein LOC123683776 n=1 Tax=Harmonia axyridis TaxID=115357 RepID=UPI001E277BF0|nr:uncharacterized protein LOC123683776 [Harmonia axyridis]